MVDSSQILSEHYHWGVVYEPKSLLFVLVFFSIPAVPDPAKNYPKGSMFEIEYQNNGTLTNQTYVFECPFNYTYDEAPDWTMKASWKADFKGLNYRFEIYFQSANGSEWIIYGKNYDPVTERVKVLKSFWNQKNNQMLTGAGSTDLKRRLYYEKYYKPLLEYYIKIYPFSNVTFEPQFVTFTYEGFRNETSMNSTENPIYATYISLKYQHKTNLTWTEYWENWINSTDATEMWQIISENANKTRNSLYENWDELVMPWTRPYEPWKKYFTWEEMYTIFNLTVNTVKDDEQTFIRYLNKTDMSSPAYARWVKYWNDTIPWDTYVKGWEYIQYWMGRKWFLS